MSRSSNEVSAIPSGLSSGVWVTFFPKCWLFPAPALTVKRTIVDEIATRASLGSPGWPGLSARVQGLVYAPENGEYEFVAKVGFASWFYLDGELVVYVPGDWAAPDPRDPIGTPSDEGGGEADSLPSYYRSAPVFLTRGLHRIQYDRVSLDSDDQGGRLQLRWRRPGMAQFETIASEYLHHTLPIVNCVSPRELSTPGGAATIHGLGFDQVKGVEVTWDGAAVTDATVVSAESATCTLPGHPYGRASLTLTNKSDNRSGTPGQNRVTNHERPGTYGIAMLTDADNDPATANLSLVPGSATQILIALEGQSVAGGPLTPTNPVTIAGTPAEQTVGVESGACYYYYYADERRNLVTGQPQPDWDIPGDPGAEVEFAGLQFPLTFGTSGTQTLVLSSTGVSSGEATVAVSPRPTDCGITVGPDVPDWNPQVLAKDRRMVKAARTPLLRGLRIS